MARRFVSLIAAVVFHAGCGAGGGEPQPDAAAPASCTTSAECGAGRWCNPLGSSCEPRDTATTFDRDVYPVIRDVCAGCHVPGGVGAKDRSGTGVNAIFSDGAARAYASLVAGGTSCATQQRRLCVDEPKNSLAVIRILPDHATPDQTFVLPDGYADPWVQTLLSWVAAGAHRDASTIPDAGVADPPPDAPRDAAPPRDAPATPPPDAPQATPDADIIPDAAEPPPDAAVTPDARPRPDGTVADTTPPVGGAVTAAVADSCGRVTLTLSPSTDDHSSPGEIAHEICWSQTAGGCLSSFVTQRTITGTGPYGIDLALDEGTTVQVAARARDADGNVNAATAEVAVSIPSFLSWPPGDVTVDLGPAPGQYEVGWPMPSSLCPSRGPLQLRACADQSCQTVSASPVTLTASCATTTFSVIATAGRTTTTRSAARAWTVPFSAVEADTSARCKGCHGVGFPSFTRADIDHPSALCDGKVLISAGDPGASQIHSVARDRAYLCGGAHLNHTMTPEEADRLRCWIEQGAPP